jgi:hypothetical protein
VVALASLSGALGSLLGAGQDEGRDDCGDMVAPGAEALVAGGAGEALPLLLEGREAVPAEAATDAIARPAIRLNSRSGRRIELPMGRRSLPGDPFPRSLPEDLDGKQGRNLSAGGKPGAVWQLAALPVAGVRIIEAARRRAPSTRRR